MTRYNDNPKRKLKTVKMHDGNIEYLRNTKYIGGRYYLKERDCTEIDGKWYLLSDPRVLWDHALNKYNLQFKMIHGVVDYKNNDFVLGSFTPDIYNNVEVFAYGVRCFAISEDILPKDVFKLSKEGGMWVRGMTLGRLGPNFDKFTYNSDDNKDLFQQRIDAFANYKQPISKNIAPYARMLGDTTFGIEIETSSGYLPLNMQYRTGVIVCRDGSLRKSDGTMGGEYVTVPMSKTKGVQNIQYLMTELRKSCGIDLDCSLHIHLGNIPTNRGFLVALFKLSQSIQDELFGMFPYYKTNPEGVKNKNYCQKLKNLVSRIKYDDYKSYVNKAYTNLFYFLSDGMMPQRDYNRRNKIHPAGSKWNIKSRYYWINFVNTIFSGRNTVEFRLHTPTLNYMKTVIWLFICNAIVKTAEANECDILKGTKTITLKDVINHYQKFGENGKFLSEYLWAYYEYKRDRFNADYSKGDKVSMHDVDEDNTFDFSYKGVSYLF